MRGRPQPGAGQSCLAAGLYQQPDRRGPAQCETAPAEARAIPSRLDHPETAFFLDPPYLECERYEVPFDRDDHMRLRDVLHKTGERWLLTYNDHECIREMYWDCWCHAVAGRYSLASTGWTPGDQLIITNYEPSADQIEAAKHDLELLNTGGA